MQERLDGNEGMAAAMAAFQRLGRDAEKSEFAYRSEHRAAGLSPMLAQTLHFKGQCGCAVLFYRMGAFYETFGEDAHIVARLADIRLTSRGEFEGKPITMCGVPAPPSGFVRGDVVSIGAWESFPLCMAKVLQAGHALAVCEQIEDDDSAKTNGRTTVRREIVFRRSPADNFLLH